MLQASAFLLSVTNTLGLTNTLAYYGMRRLQIRNVFIVQAPGLVCFANKNENCQSDSKPVKQEVNSTAILPPLVFPALGI